MATRKPKDEGYYLDVNPPVEETHEMAGGYELRLQPVGNADETNQAIGSLTVVNFDDIVNEETLEIELLIEAARSWH
ncbi:MAG: hypothetical protein MJA83_14735 [Gammaproteobacteria bacterium]|nr:hypothetical protein [Gammaproteobacteria bacterium]